MKFIIQKLIFLANKNNAESSYQIQTLHSKKKKKTKQNMQVFGAEDMYLKLITDIMAFQSIRIVLSFFFI